MFEKIASKEIRTPDLMFCMLKVLTYICVAFGDGYEDVLQLVPVVQPIQRGWQFITAARPSPGTRTGFSTPGTHHSCSHKKEAAAPQPMLPTRDMA